VAPKRNPGCHSVCPEYIKEKAEHDAQMAEAYKKRKLEQDLTAQRGRAVSKALGSKRKSRGDFYER
jgi:hypothetical protein